MLNILLQLRQREKVHVQDNNLYDSRSELQRRLHSFAGEHKITLLREEVPDWETRLEILRFEIEQKYVAIINRTSNGST